MSHRLDPASIGTLAELQAADEAGKRARAEARRHNRLCPALRRAECTCAANLETHRAQLADPNAVRKGVLVQVHAGGPTEREVADPSRSGKTLTVPAIQPPRWVCGECGWACRGDDVGHKCDDESVRVAKAPEPLYLRVPVERRYAGGYVLAVHRTLEGTYVLRELVVEEGRVLASEALGEAEPWDVVSARLTSEVVERFTP